MSEARIGNPKFDWELSEKMGTFPSGQHVIQGDAAEVMRRMTSKFDIIVTSPPYNLQNTSGGGIKACNAPSSNWRGAPLKDGYETHSDDMDHMDYVRWQRDCLDAMMGRLNECGAIFYNHKWRVQDGLIQDRQDIVGGFPVRQIIIWKRPGSLNINDTYFLQDYEVIYLIANSHFRLRPKMNQFGCVWEMNPAKDNPHPAPFPVDLPARIIEATGAHSVLDPFCGSGTTLVAAKQAGIRAVGIDKSPTYCDMARERLAATAERLL